MALVDRWTVSKNRARTRYGFFLGFFFSRRGVSLLPMSRSFSQALPRR